MTDKNKTPYTLDEMRAVDTLTARYMGGYNNGLSASKTLATESEQLLKERDELQAKLDKAKNALSFYGDPIRHARLHLSGDCLTAYSDIEDDHGQRARITLEEIM